MRNNILHCWQIILQSCVIFEIAQKPECSIFNQLSGTTDVIWLCYIPPRFGLLIKSTVKQNYAAALHAPFT